MADHDSNDGVFDPIDNVSSTYQDYYDYPIDYDPNYASFGVWTTVAGALVLALFACYEFIFDYLADLWDHYKPMIFDTYQLAFDTTASCYTAATTRIRIRRQYTETMPDLEPLPSHKARRKPPPHLPRLLHRDPADLEPAFVNDCDYPPGWLVYHPVLGVVLKETADKYYQSDSIELCEEPTTTIKSESAVATVDESKENTIKNTSENVCEDEAVSSADNTAELAKDQTDKIGNTSPCSVVATAVVTDAGVKVARHSAAHSISVGVEG